MLTAKIKGQTLTLPPAAMKFVKPNDEFTVIATSDTIILKKVLPPRLSDIAQREPQAQTMPLEEIAREVHRYRRSRRARRR